MHLATLKEGDVFGEISFLEKNRRSARITAIDEVTALEMDNQKLHELFEANNHIGYVVISNIANILSQRLLDINSRLRDNI